MADFWCLQQPSVCLPSLKVCSTPSRPVSYGNPMHSTYLLLGPRPVHRLCHKRLMAPFLSTLCFPSFLSRKPKPCTTINCSLDAPATQKLCLSRIEMGWIICITIILLQTNHLRVVGGVFAYTTHTHNFSMERPNLFSFCTKCVASGGLSTFLHSNQFRVRLFFFAPSFLDVSID